MSLSDFLGIALQLHRGGQLAEAETIYRQILAVEPHHARALYFLGVIAHQTSRNELAMDLILKAISLAPTMPDFHCGLGLALAGLGRTEEAVTAYRKALQLAPSYLEAHFNLGNALEKVGRLADAV
ncbi:MAG TPA: tetratricopeptide repeat protein, partial [Chthoniobacteraceae bacterium]